MFRLFSLRILRLVPIAILFVGVQAIAQVEVAPDHFDAVPQNDSAHRNAAKGNVKIGAISNHHGVISESHPSPAATAHGSLKGSHTAIQRLHPGKNSKPSLASNRTAFRDRRRADATVGIAPTP